MFCFNGNLFSPRSSQCWKSNIDWFHQFLIHGVFFCKNKLKTLHNITSFRRTGHWLPAKRSVIDLAMPGRFPRSRCPWRTAFTITGFGSFLSANAQLIGKLRMFIPVFSLLLLFSIRMCIWRFDCWHFSRFEYVNSGLGSYVHTKRFNFKHFTEIQFHRERSIREQIVCCMPLADTEPWCSHWGCVSIFIYSCRRCITFCGTHTSDEAH